jgi:hypothetical protein
MGAWKELVLLDVSTKRCRCRVGKMKSSATSGIPCSALMSERDVDVLEIYHER